MKKYDVNSIKIRLLNKLKTYSGWNKIISDSVVDIILSTIAEGISETDRYYEYLLQEAKWDTCRNESSLLTMLSLFNYPVKRKTSAIGSVVMSHNNLSSIISEDELENLSEYNDNAVVIPKGTTLYINNIPFTVTASVLYDLGSKYKTLPVIQGITRSVELDPLDTTVEFLKVFFNNKNIEAAGDSVSEQFFSIELVLPDLSIIPCRIVDNILLATDEEYAVEIKNIITGPEEEQGIQLLFGNNVTGLMPPKNARIRINFLETLGSEGNITEVLEYFNSIVIDNKQFYYTNVSILAGGKDKWTIEEIRAKAPIETRKTETVITLQDYKTEIEKIPYVLKAKTKKGYKIEQGTNIIKEAIEFTALLPTGEPPDKDTIESDLIARIQTRKSPFDIVLFTAPEKISLGVDYVRAQSNVFDTNSFKKILKDIIYNDYNIYALNFGEKISAHGISSVLDAQFGKGTLLCQIKAKKVIEYSEFIDTDFGDKTYSFSFNPIFSFMRRGTEVPYIEKIDLRCRCINNTEYERTILVIKDELGNLKLLEFYYADINSLILTTESLAEKLSSGLLVPIPETSPDYFPLSVSIVNTSNLLQTTLLLNTSAINYLSGKLPYFEIFSFPLNHISNEITSTDDFQIFDIAYEDIKTDIEVVVNE